MCLCTGDYMGNRAMLDSLGPAFANHSMSMEYLGEDIMLRNNTANSTSILRGGVLQVRLSLGHLWTSNVSELRDIKLSVRGRR